MVVVDVDSGRIILWNSGAERLFGHTATDAIGQHIETLIPSVVELLRRLGSVREPRAGDVPGLNRQTAPVVPSVTRTGEQLAVKVSLSAIEGAPVPGRCVLALIRDATERVQAREALEQQTAALRGQAQLLHLGHDAIFVRDLVTGELRFWNQGAERLYGWTRAEALGQVSNELLRTRFPHPLAEIEATVRHTERWEGELVHTNRAGQEVIVVSPWVLQRDEQGAPAAILEFNTDISACRRHGAGAAGEAPGPDRDRGAQDGRLD